MEKRQHNKTRPLFHSEDVNICFHVVHRMYSRLFLVLPNIQDPSSFSFSSSSSRSINHVLGRLEGESQSAA